MNDHINIIYILIWIVQFLDKTLGEKCYYFPRNSMGAVVLTTECESCSKIRATTADEACSQKNSLEFQFWIPFVIFAGLLLLFCCSTFILMCKFGLFEKSGIKKKCPIRFGKRRRNFEQHNVPVQIYTVNNPSFDLNTSLPDFNSVFHNTKSPYVEFELNNQESNLPPPSYDELNLKNLSNQALEKDQD